MSSSLLKLAFFLPFIWGDFAHAQAAAGDITEAGYYVCPYNRDRPEDLFILSVSPEFLRRIHLSDPDKIITNHKAVPQENGKTELYRFSGCVHKSEIVEDADTHAQVGYDAGYNSGFGKIVRPGGYGKYTKIVRLEDATPIVPGRKDDVRDDKQKNSLEATIEAEYAKSPPALRDPKFAESYELGKTDGINDRANNRPRYEPAPPVEAPRYVAAPPSEADWNPNGDGSCSNVRTYLDQHPDGKYQRADYKPSCDEVRSCELSILSNTCDVQNNCKTLDQCEAGYNDFCKDQSVAARCGNASGAASGNPASGANYSPAQVQAFQAAAQIAYKDAKELDNAVGNKNFDDCFIYKTEVADQPGTKSKPSASHRDQVTHVDAAGNCTGTQNFSALRNVLSSYATGTAEHAANLRADSDAVYSMRTNLDALPDKDANSLLTTLGVQNNPRAAQYLAKLLQDIKGLSNSGNFAKYVRDTNGSAPSAQAPPVSSYLGGNINPDDVVRRRGNVANSNDYSPASCIMQKGFRQVANQQKYLQQIIADHSLAVAMDKFLKSSVCGPKGPAKSGPQQNA